MTLTKEQIEGLRTMLTGCRIKADNPEEQRIADVLTEASHDSINALCNLALASLAGSGPVAEPPFAWVYWNPYLSSPPVVVIGERRPDERQSWNPVWRRGAHPTPPAGFALVPMEPTEEMITEHERICWQDGYCWGTRKQAIEAYKAMLSAGGRT